MLTLAALLPSHRSCVVLASRSAGIGSRLQDRRAASSPSRTTKSSHLLTFSFSARALATMTSANGASGSNVVLQPTNEQIERVTGQIHAVRARIRKASQEAHRKDEPRLVAICKLHQPTSILAAHRHADPPQLHFGENYAQELEAKARVLPESIRWHFVGKLQSNKAKLVAGIPNLFLVETLDSEKLANALEKARTNLEQQGRNTVPLLGVYIQINTSGEESKSGLAPIKAGTQDYKQSDVVHLAKHVMTSCPHLELRGVMTIGAATNSMAMREQGSQGVSSRQESQEKALSQNPDFETLNQTRLALVEALRASGATEFNDEAKKRYAAILGTSPESASDVTGGLELSVGMSNDLEVAVHAGSNNVRVGTDCFGVRPPSRDEAMAAMQHELEGSTS